MTMDEVEKRVLSRLRPQLIKEMVVTESFLSAFCQSDLLDEHLAAGIRAESNFEKRAAKLLENLPSQSSRAFFTLMEILEITNPWLSEKMKAALHDERTKDAKINIHPSVAKSATIEGFGHSRLHIDPDIKDRSSKFVQTNLYHLTEAEQRGVDKWMADELQRERRRQQFRAPIESRRQRGEFHSSKETQTDTCALDLREMFDELAIYLHGVDYDEHEDMLSFGLIQKEVKELLARTKILDNLFLNCWSKFDDTDKYSQSLPDLIDRLVHHEKRLMTTEELNKQAITKLKEERDQLKRRIRRLEDEVENFFKRQSGILPPQELQLRHRQSVHNRYTFPCPADSGGLTREDSDDGGSHGRRQHSDNPHPHHHHHPHNNNNHTTSDDINKPPLTTKSTNNLATSGVTSTDNNKPHGQKTGVATSTSTTTPTTNHQHTNNNNNTGGHDKVTRTGSHSNTTSGSKGHAHNNHSPSPSMSHHVSGVDHGGYHTYRAEPIHFEEKTPAMPMATTNNNNNNAQTDDYHTQRNDNHNHHNHNHHHHPYKNTGNNNNSHAGNQKQPGNFPADNDEYNGTTINSKHNDRKKDTTTINTSSSSAPPKLRRHASEESLRIAVSREETNSISTSSLNSDLLQPRQLSVEDLPTAVAASQHQHQQSSKYPGAAPNKQQPQPQQQGQGQHRVTRVDLQSRMQRMMVSRGLKDKQGGGGGGSTSNNAADSSTTTSSKGDNNKNKIVVRVPHASRDSSPSTTASNNSSSKSSLQTSYDAIHNTRTMTRDRSPATSSSQTNRPQGNTKHQTTNGQQNTNNDSSSSSSNKVPDNKQGLFLLANRYSGVASSSSSPSSQDNVKRQQVERYVQLGHPYRSFSNERNSRAGAEKSQSPLRSKLNIIPRNISTQDANNHNNHNLQNTGEYSSDSELVLKPSSLRERTGRSGGGGNKPTRSRSVRFANPIARSSNPHRRLDRGSRYQMDTTSTAQKKIHK